MRMACTITCLALGSALAMAQVESPVKQAPTKPGDSHHSDGRTVSPENKGIQQPQGPTGPIDTTSGGAPPESPQGQSPPGMQSAPGGSAKTVVDPEAAKKEPVAKAGQVRATHQPSADGIFERGVLTVPGSDPDNQTAPAKFSKRTDAADQLPIAAYALMHLRSEQRDRIHEILQKRMGLSGSTFHIEPVVGAEIPSEAVLQNLQPLPESLVRDIPELKGLAFIGQGNQTLLVSSTMHRVLAVVGQ